MVLLQKAYKLLLRPIERFVNRMDEKVKNGIITACCLILVFYFIAYFTPATHIKAEFTNTHLFCSLILLILIIFSIKGTLKQVAWNRLIFYVFFLSGAGLFIISFLHPIGSGYRAFSLMLMFGFPLIYYVWDNRGDYDVLYQRIAMSTAVAGMVYYGYCFLLALVGLIEIVDNRALGGFYDSNMFSMLGMVMACSAMYMLLVKRDRVWWFVISAVSLGIGINIVKLGLSRLSVLVVFGSVIAFVIYYFKIQSTFTASRRWFVKIIRLLIVLASVAFFSHVGDALLSVNANAYAERMAVESTVSEAFAMSEEVEKNVLSMEDRVLVWNTPCEISQVATADPTKDETMSEMRARFSMKDKDLNSYTAGRYTIWQGYAQFLNLTGNDFSKADWVALTNNTVGHAHNNFLEIAYRAGIPVACLHVFLEVLAIIVCVIWLFGRRYKEPAYLFSIVFMISYLVESLFDIATLPFERPAPFYFYMAMIPIFMFRGKRREAKSDNLEVIVDELTGE